MRDNRLDSQIHRAALPVHEQESGVLRVTHGRFEIRSVAHRFVVHFLNYVAALRAGIGSFAGRVHAGHHNSASGSRQSSLPGRPGGGVLYRDALQGIFAAVLRLLVPGSFRGHFRQGQRKSFFRTVAVHLHVYLGSRSHQRNVHAQFGAAVYRLAVDVQDDVTLFQSRLLGRAVGGSDADQRAPHFRFMEGLGDGGRHFLSHHTQVCARHLTVVDDLVHHTARHANRNGKTDALIPFRPIGQDGGVDADQFAAVIHQRAARVAGVDRRIGLNEVFVVFDAQIGAAGRADDTHGDGFAHAKGIADGQHVVAHLHLIGIANGDRIQGAGIYLEYGNVGLGICAHHAGFVFVLVVQDHGYGGGMIYHVVVGQDVAIRADDHARTQALFLLLPRPAGLPTAVALITAKELAEHRRDSVFPSLNAGLHHTGRSNGYHRGQNLLDHRGETVAARRLVRTRELKRGWRVQNVIRTRYRKAPQAERQQYRRGRSLRSTPNRLHLHVASKKSLRITTLLPYIEWLHLYRWGKGVSGLSREVGICGTGDLVCIVAQPLRLPRRHSCRRPGRRRKEGRDESRPGRQKCLRHGSPEVMLGDDALAHGVQDHFRDAAEVEFLHELSAVRLDRVDAQVEQVGDLLAGFALSHQLQDFALAGRKQFVGIFAARALQPAHVVLQQYLADRGTEERLPGSGGADGARQVGFGRVLKQVGLGSRFQCPEHVPFVGVHTEHDHLRIRQRRANLVGRLDAIQARHADIHHYHVRFQFPGHGHSFTPVAGFSDDGEVGFGIHHHAQTRANQRVVVGKQHADRVHALTPEGMGSSAVTVVPFPG